MIRPQLHHVTFKTTRLAEMVDWYGLVVGMKPNFRDAVACFTTNDAANHRIAFLALPNVTEDAEKARHAGMHHSAFEYASFGDLMSSYDRLRKAGVEPAFCLDHFITASLYYRDPDGNFVELQADCCGNWDASSEMMRTLPDFAANPIGTFFDPAKVYDRFMAGAEFKSILTEIRAKAYLPDPIPDITTAG